MEKQFEEIRDQQKAAWNKFASGWKKWDDLTMDFLRPMGDKIIRLLNPHETARVLDVASGTGEPGLTIASVVKKGQVVLTDLSEDMLEIARENAKKRGIRNIETTVCDVSDLPFEENYFDAISCRFGFMFFPDMQQAANEMSRVLKPGGKLATTVWNLPEKNFWITALMNSINQHVEVTPPPPGAPGMFRCAADGLMADLLSRAGLKNISQKEVAGYLHSKTADVYWEMMTEIAPSVVAALNKTDDATKNKIKSEVTETVNRKYPDGDIKIDASALIIYGEK